MRKVLLFLSAIVVALPNVVRADQVVFEHRFIVDRSTIGAMFYTVKGIVHFKIGFNPSSGLTDNPSRTFNCGVPWDPEKMLQASQAVAEYIDEADHIIALEVLPRIGFANCQPI